MSNDNASEILRAGLQHQDALKAYAFSILRDWSLAEDAVQEALVAVNGKADEFSGGSIVAWIRGFVRFQALQIIRKRKRHAFVEDQELLGLIDQQFDQHLGERELGGMLDRKEALRACIRQIEPVHARLLVGFYRDALPCGELAKLFDRSVNAVRLSLSRTRKALKSCVAAKVESLA